MAIYTCISSELLNPGKQNYTIHSTQKAIQNPKAIKKEKIHPLENVATRVGW